MKTILILFFLFCEVVSAQLLSSVKVNTSSTTAYKFSYSSQGSNHYYTFRRGTGTTTSDKQILVCVSNNGGNNFSEKNITIGEAVNTFTPIIASTNSSVVVLYAYKDASNNNKVCIARSMNNGNTFTLTSSSDPDFYLTVEYLQFSRNSYGFISDNSSKYYLLIAPIRKLFSSTDNGQSFNQIPAPNISQMSNDNDIRMAAHPTLGLWIAYDNYDDTLHVYYTTNNGTNYFHRHSFYIDLSEAEYDCSFNGNQFLLFYSYEEVGQNKIFLKKITVTSVSSPSLVYTSNSGVYDFDTGNKTDFLGIAYNRKYFLFSSNNGSSWTKPTVLGAELFPYEFHTFTVLNNTTIAAGFLVYESSTSVNNIYHSNIMITDKPFFTTVTINQTFGYGLFNWKDYVEVTHHQFQLAIDEQFNNVIFDTLMNQLTNNLYTLLTRFCTSGNTYYYRIKGKLGTYSTGWSIPGHFDFVMTDIEDDNISLNGFSISQNYPNPFNPNTKIKFVVPEESRVTITLYDILGNEVLKLLDEQKSHGSFSMDFNAAELPAGVYLYRMKAGDFIQTRKMILIK